MCVCVSVSECYSPFSLSRFLFRVFGLSVFSFFLLFVVCVSEFVSASVLEKIREKGQGANQLTSKYK